MRLRSSEVNRTCKRSVEWCYEHSFTSGMRDARGRLRELPVLVQCAVRVHDRREPRGALIFALGVEGKQGPEERYVVVAQRQRRVLIFSSRGGLDAAGTLVPSPSAPVVSGQRWTHIEWCSDLSSIDWY